MPDGSLAQQLIADYLRGQQKEPNADNISRALAAASINPGLIPGLSVGGTGEYSPGDPRTGGLQPGNAPIALPVQPARRSVSAPTQVGSTQGGRVTPGAVGAPSPSGAQINMADLAGLVGSNQPPPTQVAPPAPTPAPTPPAATGAAQQPEFDRLGRRRQVPSAPAPTPTPTPQLPAPNAGGDPDQMMTAIDRALQSPATQSQTGMTTPNEDVLARQAAIPPIPGGPAVSSERQHNDRIPRTPTPVAVPTMPSQRLGINLPPVVASAVDLGSTIVNNLPPAKPFSEMTVHDHAQAAIQNALGFAGGGIGGAGEVRALPRPAEPRVGSVPTAGGPRVDPTKPWGTAPPVVQQPSNVLGTGGSVPRAGPQPSPFPSSAPTPQVSPWTGKIIGANTTSVPQAGPTVAGPSPGMTASSPTVTNSPVAQLVNQQLAPRPPAPPATPTASPSVIAQLQAAIARSQAASAQRAAGPTPVAQLIEQELQRRAALGPSGQPPIMPAPNMPVVPPSTPPPVRVPAPTAQPIPTPASTTVPLPLLEELGQVGKSRPVVVPESAPSRSITIEQGRPPDVQAVPTRGAGPRRELTSSDVPKEKTVRESMAERLNAKRAQERRGLRNGG